MSASREHSEWRLEPDSPYYDEFSDIQTGQWWITTPNGLIGCSSEEDATTILGLFERFADLQREYRDYYEMTRSLVAQLEQMEVEREELENLVSQLLRDSNTVGGGQIGC